MNLDELTSLSESSDAVPSYVRAADNHNLGNQQNSWFDIGAIGSSIANIPTYMTVASLSGLNSFYNTGVKLGNFLGGDFQEQKTSALISGIDSDLGAYYRANQASADLGGFLLGSLLPGMAGVKILNAGQKALAASESGIIGTNLGLALGLRATKIDSYISSAATEISQGQAIFSSLGTSGVKALASGVYQNVLEGIAFETAIQATMQASPILEGQDKQDILWNVAMGGLFGGAAGGAVSSAQTYGAIRYGREGVTPGFLAMRKEIQTVGARSLSTETGDAATKIIVNTNDLYHGPTIDPGDPLTAAKTRELAARQVRIEQDSRSQVVGLTNGNDLTLARQIADGFVGDAPDSVMSRVLGTTEFARLGGKTATETAIAEAVQSGEEIPEGLQVHYWKLTGEDAGTIMGTAPVVANIADNVAETAARNSRQAVMGVVENYGFRPGKLWDAAAKSLGPQGHIEAEARYIWASLRDSLPEGPLKIHQNDIPLLQASARLGKTDISLVNNAGQVLKEGFASIKELQEYTISVQKDVARQLQEQALKNGTHFGAGSSLAEAQDWISHKIAKITNTTVDTLEGTGRESYDAIGDAQKAYDSIQAQRGLKPVKDEENDIRFLPSWVKVGKRVPDMSTPDGHVMDAITWAKTRQKLAQDAADRVVAKQAGQFNEQLPTIDDVAMSKLSPTGTGSGFASFANPGYNDPGTLFGMVGSVTQRMAAAAKKLFATDTEGAVTALGRDQESVIEWGGLHQKTSRSAKLWIPDDGSISGVRGLLSKEVLDSKGALKSEFQGYTPEDFASSDLHIPVVRDQTWDMVTAHVRQEDSRIIRANERAAAHGLELSKETGVFRPIPPDPKDYPFIAIVSDPKVTGQGHKSMLFADSAEKLQQLMTKARQARPDLDILTKEQTSAFFEARGAYEYDRTLSENYINSSRKNEGVYSDYFLKTDPQKVIDEFNTYHTRRWDVDTREVIRTKYWAQFDFLEDQARNYGQLATSRLGGSFDLLEKTSQNPYLSYLKTALNLSRINEHPLWYSFNRTLDDAVSKVVGKFGDLVDSIKGESIPEEKLTELNGYLQKYGLNTGYYDAATSLLVNHTAPKNELSKFIRGANVVLSRLTLGLDPLNALNNFLGANILRGTELTQITDAIKGGNADLAGKLAALGKVDITGQGDMIMSPAKLIAGSLARYTKLVAATAEDLKTPAYQELATTRQLFRSAGFIRDISDQFGSILQDFTLTGSESSGQLQSRLARAISKTRDIAEAGQRWTKNQLAEEANRFISADVMKRITDLAVERGLMDSKEQLAYINTFVNRVEGNVIASQRPLMFQGPVGQAIGLFQSYQFNLMQQMFRYVSEGSAKDAAMLLGLQGTFYGIQGLPAFQAINQHIIGTLSGNTKHIDAYDATYGIAGKNLGDVLLYGIPSNILQTNLYGRGDINPRQVTIIPTALNEVPIVGATMKFFGAMKDTAAKISAGGQVWESLLQGIEHNGISRPLAGLAQTLQATAVGTPMSTSSRGDILFTNDLVSLATLSRLAGGRPLDEAIVNDGVFRINTYQQHDHARQLSLAEAIKGNTQAGQDMDWGQFASQYAERGGKQVNFNKFMISEIKAASVSQSEKIVSQLKNPLAQKVQVLMGGSLSDLNQ